MTEDKSNIGEADSEDSQADRDDPPAGEVGDDLDTVAIDALDVGDSGGIEPIRVLSPPPITSDIGPDSSFQRLLEQRLFFGGIAGVHQLTLRSLAGQRPMGVLSSRLGLFLDDQETEFDSRPVSLTFSRPPWEEDDGGGPPAGPASGHHRLSGADTGRRYRSDRRGPASPPPVERQFKRPRSTPGKRPGRQPTRARPRRGHVDETPPRRKGGGPHRPQDRPRDRTPVHERPDQDGPDLRSDDQSRKESDRETVPTRSRSRRDSIEESVSRPAQLPVEPADIGRSGLSTGPPRPATQRRSLPITTRKVPTVTVSTGSPSTPDGREWHGPPAERTGRMPAESPGIDRPDSTDLAGTVGEGATLLERSVARRDPLARQSIDSRATATIVRRHTVSEGGESPTQGISAEPTPVQPTGQRSTASSPRTAPVPPGEVSSGESRTVDIRDVDTRDVDTPPSGESLSEPPAGGSFQPTDLDSPAPGQPTFPVTRIQPDPTTVGRYGTGGATGRSGRPSPKPLALTVLSPVDRRKAAETSAFQPTTTGGETGGGKAGIVTAESDGVDEVPSDDRTNPEGGSKVRPAPGAPTAMADPGSLARSTPTVPTLSAVRNSLDPAGPPVGGTAPATPGMASATGSPPTPRRIFKTVWGEMAVDGNRDTRGRPGSQSATRSLRPSRTPASAQSSPATAATDAAGRTMPTITDASPASSAPRRAPTEPLRIEGRPQLPAAGDAVDEVQSEEVTTVETEAEDRQGSVSLPQVDRQTATPITVADPSAMRRVRDPAPVDASVSPRRILRTIKRRVRSTTNQPGVDRPAGRSTASSIAESTTVDAGGATIDAGRYESGETTVESDIPEVVLTERIDPAEIGTGSETVSGGPDPTPTRPDPVTVSKTGISTPTTAPRSPEPPSPRRVLRRIKRRSDRSDTSMRAQRSGGLKRASAGDSDWGERTTTGPTAVSVSRTGTHSSASESRSPEPPTPRRVLRRIKRRAGRPDRPTTATGHPGESPTSEAASAPALAPDAGLGQLVVDRSRSTPSDGQFDQQDDADSLFEFEPRESAPFTVVSEGEQPGTETLKARQTSSTKEMPALTVQAEPDGTQVVSPDTREIKRLRRMLRRQQRRNRMEQKRDRTQRRRQQRQGGRGQPAGTSTRATNEPSIQPELPSDVGSPDGPLTGTGPSRPSQRDSYADFTFREPAPKVDATHGEPRRDVTYREPPRYTSEPTDDVDGDFERSPTKRVATEQPETAADVDRMVERVERELERKRRMDRERRGL